MAMFDGQKIQLDHGSGGSASHNLITELFFACL
jgi:hypothetical protein